MSASSHAGYESLSFDRLRRLQSSLTRRVVQRDVGNILQVGFAPQRSDRLTSGAQPSLPITAQFDVVRKLQRVPSNCRIDSVESVRLLDRGSRSYLQLGLQTDLLPTGSIVPTGVRVANNRDFATTSAVVRWCKVDPVPALDSIAQVQDPRWRWGVLCVAHLFAQQPLSAANQVQVERQHGCDAEPSVVSGSVIVRGRIPGGPDISLIETGLDRLWLSGLLPNPSAPPLQSVSTSQLLGWISAGTTGTFLGDGVTHGWRWQTFYPELQIESLGRLRHIVRYHWTGGAPDVPRTKYPFGHGSSGGVLIAGGIPIGLQIASIEPDFQVAFAQSFDVSLGWLQHRLRATALHMVHLVL